MLLRSNLHSQLNFLGQQEVLTSVVITFFTIIKSLKRSDWFIRINCMLILGICAVNSVTALTLDNSTTNNFNLNQDCYTIAVADCSSSAYFIVGIKMNTSDSTLVSNKTTKITNLRVKFWIMNVRIFFRMCAY